MKIFHLTDPGAGWIDVTFGPADTGYTLGASNVLGDTLRDLAIALAFLLRGDLPQPICFFLEPAFAYCHLRREKEHLQLSISIDHEPEPDFKATYPLVAFAQRFCFEMRRTQPHYAPGWYRTFPETDLATLEALLP